MQQSSRAVNLSHTSCSSNGISAIEQQKSRRMSTSCDKSARSSVRRQSIMSNTLIRSTLLHFFRQPNVSYSLSMELRHHHLYLQRNIRSTTIPRPSFLQDQSSDHFSEMELLFLSRTLVLSDFLISISIDLNVRYRNQPIETDPTAHLPQRYQFPEVRSGRREEQQQCSNVLSNGLEGVSGSILPGLATRFRFIDLGNGREVFRSFARRCHLPSNSSSPSLSIVQRIFHRSKAGLSPFNRSTSDKSCCSWSSVRIKPR